VKYHQITAESKGAYSRWIRPVHEGYRLACCDCGSVHKVDFRVVDGFVEIRFARHRRATAQIRRHMKRKGKGVLAA
jgi:hypothetical protein